MGFPTKNEGKKGGHSIWPPLFSSPQLVRDSPFGLLILRFEYLPHSLESNRVLFCGRNNPQKTTELFSFGRPKEEKTRSLLHPLREATTSTRPHYSLGTVNSVNWRVNVVNRRPLHRQRESGGVRKHPRDTGTMRKRTLCFPRHTLHLELLTVSELSLPHMFVVLSPLGELLRHGQRL
ncbi:hypothetical protein Taro_041064 [Colocasia esculenta]|uniref:Uncharacterized protein n=1 Tax=Colocasia esculenta TaxID=4460 RepID=A0A843WAI9_COLES|nr:hypothetical protein [Colocasia esculenta]